MAARDRRYLLQYGSCDKRHTSMVRRLFRYESRWKSPIARPRMVRADDEVRLTSQTSPTHQATRHAVCLSQVF
jgi:hypothetical protein